MKMNIFKKDGLFDIPENPLTKRGIIYWFIIPFFVFWLFYFIL